MNSRDRLIAWIVAHPWLLRLFGDFIWFALGIAAFLAGLRFFLEPSYIAKTALGRNLSGGLDIFGVEFGLDEAWNITWTLGGLILAIGVVTRVPRTELIGLQLVTCAMTINSLAIAFDIGLSPSLVALAIFTLGCLLRAIFVALTAPRRPDNTLPCP